MIKRLYEAFTGTPWTTVTGGRMLAADYPEWQQLTDAELMAMTTAEAIRWAENWRALTEITPTQAITLANAQRARERVGLTTAD